MLKSNRFMMRIILILLVVSAQHLLASVQVGSLEDNLVWLLGECARGKSLSEVHNQSFYKNAKEEAENILAHAVDVEYAETKVVEYAQWFLNTYKARIAPWCQDVSFIRSFVNRKLPNAHPKQKAFCRIAMCLALADAVWKELPNCMFLQPEEPKYFSARLRDSLEAYIKNSKDYIFILSEEPRTSYLVELLAMSKGKKVINVPINCWHQPYLYVAKEYKGLLNGLRYMCCSGTSDLDEILDAHYEGLGAIMREQVMKVIDDHWEEFGVQNMIAAHHMFCERQLRVFVSLAEDLMEYWVKVFVSCSSIYIRGSDAMYMVRSFADGVHDVVSLRKWELMFWEALLSRLPKLQTHSRQLRVFCDVYSSWFPEEQPIYGIEGYKNMAIEAMKYICDHTEEISDQEREILFGVAHWEWKEGKEFLFCEQKSVSSFTSGFQESKNKRAAPFSRYDRKMQQSLQEAAVPHLRLPKRETLESCGPEEKKLYLESIIKSFAICIGNNDTFARELPMMPDYIQKVIKFYMTKNDDNVDRRIPTVVGCWPEPDSVNDPYIVPSPQMYDTPVLALGFVNGPHIAPSMQMYDTPAPVPGPVNGPCIAPSMQMYYPPVCYPSTTHMPVVGYPPVYYQCSVAYPMEQGYGV